MYYISRKRPKQTKQKTLHPIESHPIIKAKIKLTTIPV